VSRGWRPSFCRKQRYVGLIQRDAAASPGSLRVGALIDLTLADALAASFADRLPVSEFAQHNFAGGQVRRNRFPAACGGEEVIEATAANAAPKRRALTCIRSERANLRHVAGGASEIRRPLPAHDFGAPSEANSPVGLRPTDLFREHPRLL
jgi:hypothetical protein